MTPLAQRILNAYDNRDRDALQQVAERVQELERRLAPPARMPGRRCDPIGSGCVRGCAPGGMCILAQEAREP